VKIISLNVGKPTTLTREDQSTISAIEKKPVTGELYLSRLNFTGDTQADLVNHGGFDKAVCVYPYEHYSYWEKEMGVTLSYAAFGENLTVSDWIEEEACIGDIYRIGSTIVQISQPRQPCFKLALRLGFSEAAKQVLSTGFTGFYLRVLEEGVVSKDSTIKLLERHPMVMSVAEANRIKHHSQENLVATEKLLAVQELSDNWRQSLQKRLKTPNE
jgi:MOSC domain-containing protein YiiM